jgi:hypothetical protein
MNLSTRRAFLAAVGGIAVAPALALAPQPAATGIRFDNIIRAVDHFRTPVNEREYSPQWTLHPNEIRFIKKHNLIKLDI